MANGGRIDFEVGFNVNVETLKKASQEIRSIQSLVADDLIQGGDTRAITEIEDGLKKAKDAAKQLGDVFDSSFNKDLGVMNIAKFQQQLQKSGITLKTLQQDLQGAGAVGTSAFRQICNQILTTNNYIKKTDTVVSKIATTLGNTLKWNISSSAINKLSGSIQEAWGFTKALDGSLNDIQIVTNKSSEDMKKFAIQANDAAKALGTTTTAYTNASLTFYQQGLSDEDVAARAETSLKVSNVTGLSGDQSAEYVTAVLNGYKVAAEDAENAMDKLAAVGAATASSLAELSEGMAKVASAANAMGVSEDQLAATLATVISVTRQDASTVGTAFKTIYARISDIKAGSEDAEVSLGNYTKKMAEMGFSVLDSAGNMRDLGEVMEEIGGKWETLTKEQQISLAQTMAGTRQYNNLIALFDNWAQYEDALSVSMEANGTLQEQQEIYAKSYTAKLNELTAAKEKLFMSFVDNDGIKDLITAFTKIIDQLGIFIEKIGGGKTVLQELGIIAMKVFDKQISASVAKIYKNIKGAKQNKENAVATMMLSEQMKGTDDKIVQGMADDYQKIIPIIKNMSAEEQNATLALLRQKNELAILNDKWEENSQSAQEYFDKLTEGQIKLDFDNFDEKTKEEAQKQLDSKYDSAQERLEGLGDYDDYGLEKIQAEETYNKLLIEQETLWNSIVSAGEEASEVDMQRFEELSNDVQKAKNEMENLQTVAGKDLDLIPEGTFKDEIIELQNQLDELNILDDEEDYKKIYEKLKNAVETGLREGWDKGQEYLDNYDEDSVNKAKSNKKNGETAQTNFDNVIDTGEAQLKIKAMLDLAAGISQVAMGIQQLKSLGRIWEDEDLSVGEKILQTLMTMSMIVPAIVTAFSTLTSVKQAYVAILKSENLELTKEQIAEYGAAQAKIAKTIATIKETIAEHGLIGTIKLATVALWNEIKALVAKAAAWAMANPELAAAVAISTAFIGISIAVANALNADAKAAENAANVLAETKQNLEDTKNTYEELQNTINKYQDGVEALDKLKQGTDEWKQAVMELNEQVLTLMQLYPELASYVTSSGGVLSIEQEGLDMILEKQQQKVQDAQTAYVRNSNVKAVADYKKDTGNYTAAGMDGQINNKDLVKLADANGDIAGILGILLADNNKSDEYHRQAMVDQLNEAAGTDYSTDTWIQYLQDNSEELQNTVNATRELESTLSVNNDILAANAIDDKIENGALTGESEEYYTNLDEESQQLLKNTASTILSNQMDNYEYKIGVKKEDIQGLKGGEDFEKGINDEDDARLVLKANGKDPNAYDIESAGGGNFKYRKKGDTGDWEKENYAENRDAVYNMLKQQEMEDTFDIDGLVEKFSQVEDKYGSTVSDIIQKYISSGGDLSSLTKKELDSISQVLENEDFSEDFKSIFGEDFDWESMGAATGDIFINGLKSSISDRENISPEDLFGRVKEKAESFGQDAANLAQYDAGYLNADNVDSVEGYQELVNYSDDIIEAMPQLKDEMNTFLDESKIGTQEWLDAVKEIQSTMGGIAEDADGIFTKEDAEKYNLTEAKLTEQYNRGDITQEQYQQKFQGAMDYELEDLGIDQEEFDEYAETIEDLTEQYELSDEMVQRIAKDNLKLQKTVDTLTSDWEEYGDIIKSEDKNNIKYAQGIGKMRESVEDMFGTDISDDFIADHLEEIERLANGDLTVFDELQKAATQDLIMEIATEIDDPALQETFAEMNNIIANADIENLEVGASLESTEFGNALADLVNSSNLTVEEMQKIFDSFGFEPSIDYEEVAANSVNLAQTHAYIKGADGTYQEITDQAQLENQTTVWIPKINSSSTVYKGSPKNTISPKSSGGKGKGGGGGGGKEKDPDKMDKLDDEIDRYHDINIQIALLETQYDRLGKAQDKLLGKDLINNLNQQLKILEKQIDAYKTKIALEKQEAAELQGDLGAKGVKFNDNGTIVNYAESLKAQENYVNSLIDKYNSMSAEEQESYKEVVEKAKEDYEKFKENIDRYDTIITEEIPGLEDQIQDAVDQQIEINIKKFTMGVEIRLEMKEAEQDWNKFKRKIIDGMKDDNILGQGLESFENYRDYFDLGGGQGGTVDALTKQVNNTMAEIQKMQAGEMSNIFGNDMSKAMETLTTYNSELMTQLEDMEDLVESIEEGLLDTMDEVKEKMDAQVEAYEYVNDLLESDMELVQMLYGEDSYEALGNYYAQKHENYKQALDFDKQEVAFWQQEMEAAKASGNEEAYQKALENYREGVNKLNEDVKASVQNIIDSYSNTINQIFDKLDKKMSGKAGGMDSLREEWELINTNADRYLDTINSTYEVQKLQNKYKTSINAAESTKVQQKLNALMEEEIGMLEKKDKLSQYDIDRANMKYDIALKQIALEEAQQNKSSMRMKRDAQGNYSYVYAGDEDDISSKTQELADAQNQLYNLDKDQYRQNMDDIVSYTAEMQEKIKELYEDPAMDPVVREEREKTIREQYGELINNIIADNESIRANLHESTFDSLSMLYETDADNFRTMTGLENDDWSDMTDDMLNNIQTKMIPTWDGSVQHMIDTFIADGGIGPTIDQVFKDADEALKNYESSLSEVEAAAGISFDAIKSGTDAASESVKELIGDNKEIMDQCKEQIEEYKDLIAQVKDLAAAYDGVRDAAIRAANAAHTLAEEINNQSVSAADDPTIGPNMPSPSSPSGPTVDPNGPGGNPTNPASGDGSGDGVLNVGDEVTYTGGKYYADSYGGGKSGERGPGKKVKVTIIKNDGRPYPIHVESSDSAYGWLKKEQLSGFKSGGFTGSWQGGVDRDDGRLALLHQKELVLNADDTDNFLKAMQDLRKAQNEIKTVSSSGVISAMFNSISDAITAKMQNLQSAQADMLNAKGPAGGGLTGTIQNITINADFPEVSDANEIRKAFDQIIGMASQKASNKSR